MTEPTDFIFTERMIELAYSQEEAAKTEKGLNPFPRSLKKSSDFALSAWDNWLLLVPFLKKELQKRCPEKNLGKSNGDPLFILKHVDKVFELHILQRWAAKKLGLPKRYIFKQSNSTEVYVEIVCKFLH